MIPDSLYCDGGVIGPNPSALGGTWCYCWADGDGSIHYRSGVVTPEDLGVVKVSNNHTEALAALKALESVPKGWDGTLFSDSVVTLIRVTVGQKMNNLPQWLRLRILDVRRARKYKVKHVKGHTTEEQRRDGVGHDLNVFCDGECNRLAKWFLSLRGGEK